MPLKRRSHSNSEAKNAEGIETPQAFKQRSEKLSNGASH
jgi:hypothetical protein